VRCRTSLIKTQGSRRKKRRNESEADDLLKQIKAGGGFRGLAKKNSEDTGSGAEGRRAGWIVRGQTVPNFEKSDSRWMQGR